MITAPRPTLYPIPLLGWKETVQFPLLNLGPLIAKIDSGARTSALHADSIEVQGKKVRFKLGKKAYAAPLVAQRRVKSSNGISELRPVIRATVQLGARRMKTEITLTNRTDMDVPMLLGRNSLKNHFLVHPGKTFLLTKRPAP